MCDKSCTQLNSFVDFMAKTAQRDKVMAIVQFLPAVLEPVVRSQGHSTLGTRLQRLSIAADSYRTFTRFSWILDSCNGRSIDGIKSTNDVVIRKCRIVETTIMIFRMICEHLNYLTNWEVIPGQKGQWGRLGILLWFYALLVANVRQIYDLVQKNKSNVNVKEFQRTLLAYTVTICFTLFNLALQPTKGAATAQICGNPNSAINKFLAAITPRNLPINATGRACLGLTASAVDLYLCVSALPSKKADKKSH